MRKTITVGAALVIALTAAGHDVEATHSSADVVLKWNQLVFKARYLSRAIPRHPVSTR